MENAFELVKTQEFLAPYMYVLELMGDHERILALIRQEEITPDISDAIFNRYKEAENQCRDSASNKRVQTGLAFRNSDSPEKYREFVIDYLEHQKKNYDLS